MREQTRRMMFCQCAGVALLLGAAFSPGCRAQDDSDFDTIEAARSSIEQAATAVSCTQESDCGGGLACVAGVCQACSAHDQCQSDVCDQNAATSMGPGACIPESSVVYVRASGGPDCTTGDGSRANPDCAIDHGISHAVGPKYAVRVYPGRYFPFAVNSVTVYLFGPGDGSAIVGEEDLLAGAGIRNQSRVVLDGIDFGVHVLTGLSCQDSTLKVARATVAGDFHGMRSVNCALNLDRVRVDSLVHDGLTIQDGTYRITNSYFKAGDAPAVVFSGSSTGTFEFNTVTGGGSSAQPGGIDCGPGSRVIQDSIVVDSFPGAGQAQTVGACVHRRVVVGSADTRPDSGLIKIDPDLDAQGRLLDTPADAACCIDKGARFVSSLYRDFFGMPRPQGASNDVGACELRPRCSQPPLPPAPPAGTEPTDEAEWISESAATLEGASTATFNRVGAPITFRLSCPTLQIGQDTITVYDNGQPVPFTALTLAPDAVTLVGGIGEGRHVLHLVASDVFGFTIEQSVVLWAGPFSVPVRVIDEGGAPVPGATVVARLSDDPDVTAVLTTDASGAATFTDLPGRSYDIVASSTGNRIATQPTSAFDGLVVLRLRGIDPPSAIDNNDFSLGTSGWNIGSAPVFITPHVEGSPGGLFAALGASSLAGRGPAERTPARSLELAPRLQAPLVLDASPPDFDLTLRTSGEGQQQISRTFDVEDGVTSVSVRFRFITSEVPGGFFGTQFNDFFNVSIRTLRGGGAVTRGNSMNGLGLAAFDAGGATGWFEAELPVAAGGDTVQVDVAVANVADGLFDSEVVVDAVKKKKLTISALNLRDIDNTALGFLSASAHPYFSGNTRVNGTITVRGPKDDSLTELKVEVLEGGVVATGALASNLTGTLYRQFGDSEQIELTAPQLLFEIPASQLASANQTANGTLTLRAKAQSSSGETAEKDFGPVTKLVRFTGGARYGGRDEAVGGDDWAKPGVVSFIGGAGLTWGDFSNMNGGPFAPHQTHRTGNSADGWFAGYNARDANTAATIIGHLNTHGRRISAVYVTFAPGSVFANAIANVILNDGRAASNVIRNVAGHTTHFHWEVTDN